MSWLQTKYTSIVGSQLRNFKKKSERLYNFSCPICDDSAKSKYKARGYLFADGKTSFIMKCFNCGVSLSFDSFLKSVNPILYDQYRMEKFKATSDEVPTSNNSPKVVAKEGDWKSLLTRADSSTKALKYLLDRKIPHDKISSLYFTENISDLKQEFTEYEETNFLKEPRIAIPVFSENNSLIGIITRAIGYSKLRYINLRKKNDEHLIYNLEKVDRSQRILVLEGAFDSMFMPNAIAVDGADFAKASHVIDKERDILVYDNQPRNRQLIGLMEKMIDQGYKLCIWSDRIHQKDINSMIKDGLMTVPEITNTIEKRSYSGLNAKLELGKWRQV